MSSWAIIHINASRAEVWYLTLNGKRKNRKDKKYSKFQPFSFPSHITEEVRTTTVHCEICLLSLILFCRKLVCLPSLLRKRMLLQRQLSAGDYVLMKRSDKLFFWVWDLWHPFLCSCLNSLPGSHSEQIWDTILGLPLWSAHRYLGGFKKS